MPAEVLPASIAEDILVTTSQFNKILSATDTNVQKALETLDDHIHNSIDVIDNSRTLDEIISWFDNITASGRMWGGLITSNGDGTVSVAAGMGLSKSQSAGPSDVPTGLNLGQGSRPIHVSWNAVPSLTLIDNAYNFIYYDYTTDSIKTTDDFESIDFTQDFTLGRGYRSGADVIVRLCGTNNWNFNRRVQLFGEEIFPVVPKKGSLLIGNPSGRYISHTGGIVWAELVNRFSIDPFSSAGSDTFTYWYGDNTNGYTKITGQTLISNTQYYNGAGALATLLPQRYGVNWVYVVHDSSVHVVYGTTNGTISEAEQEGVAIEIPGLLSSYATLIGKIIIQRDALVLESVETPFETRFSSSGVSLHDELGNRTLPDSHPASAISYSNLLSGLAAISVQTAIDEIEARVDLNDLKETNTITDLSLGTITATNVPILSSDGADIATLPAATSALAGIVISGSQTFGGNKTFANDVIISGNLTVQGDNFISNTGTVTTEDDVIMLRTGASTAITTPAGLVINRYDGTNHGGMVINSSGEMRIGDLGLDANGKVTDVSQSQPVLTRDETSNLVNMDIMVWDAINYKSIGKTLAELGLALANGGTYTEITVVIDDTAGIPININAITGTTAHLQDWSVAGSLKACIEEAGTNGTPAIKNEAT